jgi:deazaflavin-dependent oxidoreductase (nitroreductase family)
MPFANPFDAQYVYLTTIGRKTGLHREIEIWFVERDLRLYILAEHGYKAHWVRNVLANPAVTIKIGDKRWIATGRVLDDEDGGLFAEVRELERTKYGWGDGLPVEFRLEREIEGAT